MKMKYAFMVVCLLPPILLQPLLVVMSKKGNVIKFSGVKVSKPVARNSNNSDASPADSAQPSQIPQPPQPSQTIQTSQQPQQPQTTQIPQPSQPSLPSVKRNPEALLDELSGSLSTFSSTVSTWLPPESKRPKSSSTAITPTWNSQPGRAPRLGLGAKPQPNQKESDAESAGVFASLALKQKLTGVTQKQPSNPTHFNSTTHFKSTNQPKKANEAIPEEPGRSGQFSKRK